MLKVSSSLPIANYSTNVISDNAGATFNPTTNNRIRISLPKTLGMIDFHSSYIRANVRVIPPALSQDAVAGNRRNCLLMGFNNEQGANAMIRDLRVAIDNKPVEEIMNYNVLEKVSRDFGRDISLDELESTFNHAIGENNLPSYQVATYTPATPLATYNPLSHKVMMKMGLSGVLSLPIGLPVVATGNVDVEMFLDDASNVLSPFGSSQNLPCENQTIGVSTTLPFVDISYNGGDAGASYIGYGWTNSVKCPFAVGNVVKYTGTGSTTGAFTRYGLVSAVSDGGAGGSIRVTFATAGKGFTNTETISNTQITLMIGYDDPNVDTTSAPTRNTALDYSYEVSNVEYVIRAVQMPPPYLSSLQKRIQQQGLLIDIPTYSTYLDNLQANILAQTINVPCYASRVKAVLSVPLEASQTDFLYSREGQVDNIRNYQAQIGSRREPNRPLDLSNWTGNVREFPAQEYLQELQKSLTSCGIGQRSLIKWRDNFVMNRSLSAFGGTEDLGDKGFRFNVNHNSSVNTAKNVYSFVNHITRLQVIPSGLQVYS